MTLPGTADSGCEGAVLVRAQRGRPLPPRLAGSMAAQPCSNQGTSTQQKTREKGLLLKTAKNKTELKRALWVLWLALGQTDGAGHPQHGDVTASGSGPARRCRPHWVEGPALGLRHMLYCSWGTLSCPAEE